MYTLLLVALLLTILLQPAAAASPIMDSTLPVVPMESFYPDPDNILEAICDICGISVNYCAHALVSRSEEAIGSSLTLPVKCTTTGPNIHRRDIPRPPRVAPGCIRNL